MGALPLSEQPGPLFAACFSRAFRSAQALSLPAAFDGCLAGTTGAVEVAALSGVAAATMANPAKRAKTVVKRKKALKKLNLSTPQGGKTPHRKKVSSPSRLTIESTGRTCKRIGLGQFIGADLAWNNHLRAEGDDVDRQVRHQYCLFYFMSNLSFFSCHGIGNQR